MDATEDNGKELFKQKTFKSLRNNIHKLLWRRKSVTITQYDSSYKVSYLGNVLCGWTKGESCIDKPIKTLWSNYKQSSKPNVQMKVTITQSGLKALTKQHGLTEYWSNRITYCVQPSQYPKVFCWIYRHEGRKLKQELRCHAVLCSKEIVAKKICNELNLKLSQALSEFKRDKILKQNARLSLANCVYDNPSLPRRKLLLSTGSSNYKPPLERSKSAPKLMAIEEDLEEESTEEHMDYKKYSNYCIQQYGGTLKYSRPNNHHYNKFNSLKYNRSKSTTSSLNRNNSLDSILETSNNSNGSCEKIYSSCMSINQLQDNVTTPTMEAVEDIPSCSSTPVDDLEEPLTINEQLSINFNPNYGQTNTSEITTNPNPNENVKEYEIHLNPKFNLLKTTTTSSSHKLGKLLRNKSLDSILADSNANSYDASRNIHRKSWCYGDEKTLSMIDNEQQANNNKKQTSCYSSVEKLSQSSHAFSSFEHINNLIEQAVKSVGNNVPDVKSTNERLVDEDPIGKIGKKDLSMNDSVKLVTKDAVPRTEICDDTNIVNRSKEINTAVNTLNVIKDYTGKSNVMQLNKLLENNEIPIDYDEFFINTDEEANILSEFKHKKYSHHRLPSIESGFHDQIDSDSLVESNSESDTNYESLNQNSLQIVGHDDTDNISPACELLVNSHSSNKHLEAINEHVKTNTFKSFQPIYDTQFEITHRRNILVDSDKQDAITNIKTTSTNHSNTQSNTTNETESCYVTSEDVKNMCRNLPNSQNLVKNNRTSRILDKINSFNEKIELSNSTTTNKTTSSLPLVNRIKSYPLIEENKVTVNINNLIVLPKENLSSATRNIEKQEIVTDGFNNTNEIQRRNDNVTTIHSDIVNKFKSSLIVSKESSPTGTAEVETQPKQSVKNKIKEFNSLRSTFNSNTSNNNTVLPVVKKIVPTALPITNRVTITKTIRKISINSSDTKTFNANKFGTLPKLRPAAPTKLFNNINLDVHSISQSLDYSVNLTQNVDEINKNQEELETNRTVQSDTNSLVKKRKQMFEVSSLSTNTTKKIDENTNTIKNRRSLFENLSMTSSVNCNAGFYNGGQSYYNGAARFMSSNEQDEDSDESGFVESQELETLHQVNNSNFVQV